MSIFSPIVKAFNLIGKLVMKALRLAQSQGLDDKLVDLAMKWVKVAATKFVSNAEKREWVVEVLVTKGYPESLVRLAVELAYILYKREVEDKA